MVKVEFGSLAGVLAVEMESLFLWSKRMDLMSFAIVDC